MNDLDDPAVLALDVGGMLGHAAALGHEFARSWDAAEQVPLPWAPNEIDGLIVAGVGGSASAADAFAALCSPEAPVPVQVVRGWRLPGWAGPRTLVVASSYSGSTEETLAMLHDAHERGCKLAVITAGGHLGGLAAARGHPRFVIDYQSPPRAAFAHGLAPLLSLARRLGLIDLDGEAVRAAAEGHSDWAKEGLGPRIPAASNPAKQLAVALKGCVPWVLAAEHLVPAATRFKNQLAENGKTFAAAESLPEAGHNLVVALGGFATEHESVALVTLESSLHYAAAIGHRFDVVADLFASRGIPVHRRRLHGPSPLADTLLATALGDFTSTYLALARGIDPTTIGPIDELKRRTAPGA